MTRRTKCEQAAGVIWRSALRAEIDQGEILTDFRKEQKAKDRALLEGLVSHGILSSKTIRFDPTERKVLTIGGDVPIDSLRFLLDVKVRRE